jgi:hypothetical protein
MSNRVMNQSKVVVKDGVMTVTTWCGDVHILPAPHLRDCECAANPDDPHTMFIERVEVRKPRPSQ